MTRARIVVSLGMAAMLVAPVVDAPAREAAANRQLQVTWAGQKTFAMLRGSYDVGPAQRPLATCRGCHGADR